MRSLILVVAIAALAWARPETYKETEDFQYSRSSSDDGNKSGYYAAQRGNVAGNYEKAHNMDSLAQHQMSGAINQVQGEIGDAANTKAGSVYTAANTRGIYGSGYHDLSNLQGRHFGEGSSSSSHSSMSSAHNQQLNSDWRHQSQQAGYGSSSQLGQSSLHLGSLQAADAAGYGSTHGSTSRSSGYHAASEYNSQSGYNSQNNYDQSSLQSGAYGAGDQSRRYTIVAPVRIVGRPGTQIAIPVYGQAGYDAQRASSSFDHSSSNRYASQTAESAFNQNAINSEAEVLDNNQQHIGSVPTNNGKHYSSSYNYQKAWERHSETTDAPIPVAPTANPLSINSELYDDAQGARASNLQQTNSYSGNAYNSGNRYNSYSKGSSQSSHQADYRSQHSSDSNANSNAYTQGTYGSYPGLAPLVDAQPKSYQSSYSYHKSWEKQGDPYVIVPETNGGTSQKIVAANSKTSASSQHYGSNQHYSQGGAVDCDSLCRYRRSTRSADYYQQNLGQQAQTAWDQSLSQQTQDSFQQQSQSANLEDLGQQTQDLGDLGQQTQQSWGDLQQQRQSENLEDLGQHTQDLENLGQQTQNLENLGQQTQQSWGNLQQQSKSQNLEDFGQQTQGKWHESNQKIESNLDDLGQQTQHSWNNIEQQTSGQNLESLSQQTQGQWNNMATQQSQQSFENLDNLGQQTQQTWNGFDNIEQQNRPQQPEDLGQQTHNNWDDLDNLGQQAHTHWDTLNKTSHTNTNTEQQTQTHFETVDEVNKEHGGNKDNPVDNNPDDLAFWGLTNNQMHENSNYYNQHSSNNHNNYSNSQDHGVSWGQHVNNDNAQITHNNPLQSIWDKLDNMEEQSEHLSNENQQHTEYQNSQHSYGQESTDHHESNWESNNSSYHWNQHETHNSGFQPPFMFNSTIDKPKQDQVTKEIIPEKPLPKEIASDKPKDDEDETPEEPELAEVGRGDIGAEEGTKTTPKTVQNSQTYTTQAKPQKSPEEIETLSLSRGTDEEATAPDSLSVLSITQQKWLEEQRQKTTEELYQISGTRTSTTTPQSAINKNAPSYVPTVSQNSSLPPTKNDRTQKSEDIQNNYHNNIQQNTMQENQDFDQRNQQQFYNSGHQFQNSGKHNQNIDQHNQQFDQHNQNFDQQTGQEDLGQQTQDLNQQNLQQFTNLGQHSQNFDQQTGQQLEDFGQRPQDLNQQNMHQLTNLGQHSQNFDQQTGQQLEDFGQQTQDLNQQNMHQLTNLGQHSQNFDQQTGQELQDFGQQTQDLNQQNLHQLTNLGQHSQNFDQQTGQQLQDFGQQTQDLNQQNLEQFSNSEHHSQLYQHEAREYVSHPNTQLVQEPKIKPASDHGSLTHPKQDVEIQPPSVTTEKPGFWSSVGNKFTNAKDSVASWFKS